MNEFLVVLGIGFVSAVLTYLGAPLAERFDVSQRVVSAALQFAAGILTALVALSLMPPAVRSGPQLWVILAFFVGGAIFVLFEYVSARRQAAKAEGPGNVLSLGLYFGVLVDLLIDGVLVGIAATLTLDTGLLLALGLGFEGALLAFVATATAKQQGMAKAQRRQLAIWFFATVLAGAMLGYLLLRNQSAELRLVLIALASGLLITTVTQSMIPEANRDGEPSFAGIFFIGGISLYALLAVSLK